MALRACVGGEVEGEVGHLRVAVFGGTGGAGSVSMMSSVGRTGAVGGVGVLVCLDFGGVCFHHLTLAQTPKR